MSNEEKHLQNKIRTFEDMLLRSKNYGQINVIQSELTKMRAQAQRLYFQRTQP